MSVKTKQSISFLLFASMSEIMLGMYDHTTLLNQYDPLLHNKLKNLKVNFERTSKKAHTLFSEEEQLIFFNLINILESILEAASNEQDFTELIGLIKSWNAGDITMINSREELVRVAGEVG